MRLTRSAPLPNTYAGYALALDFKRGIYRDGGGLKSGLSNVAGYSYTRSGVKGDIDGSGVKVQQFAANVPAVLGGVGYYSETAVTNLFQYSQDLSQSSVWSTSPLGAGAAAVVTPNYATAPDGTQTASRVQLSLNGGTTSGDHSAISQAANFTATLSYTMSMWLKSNTGTNQTLVPFVINGQSWGTITVTPQWQRFVFTQPASSTVTSASGIRIRGTFTPDTADVLIWGAQLVQASIPGPYAPTTGSTAFVGTDTLAYTTPIAADQDFVFVAIANFGAVNASDCIIANMVDGIGNNYIALGRNGGSNIVQLTTNVGGTLAGYSIPGAVTGRNVIVGRRRAGAWTCGVKKSDGTVTLGAETAAATFPASLTKLEVGLRNSGSNLNAPVEVTGVQIGTLSDAQLTALLQAA